MGPSSISTIMQRAVKAEKEAEEARRIKRAKRKPTTATDASTPLTVEAAIEAELMAAAQDAEKKTTKKERKQAESRISEAQQHQSANEAARMATANLMGSRFGGKKNKTYSWMKAGASGTSTPTRVAGSTTASVLTTTAQDRTQQQVKEKRFGTWDEDRDPGIQARDVLPVLETDGMAARAYIRGCERLET